MSILTIYKASAGSGKTFTLTGEYLSMIFDANTSFKNILAVTFTNKATAEMRERILKELYLIASDENTQHAQSLKSKFGYSNKELQKKGVSLLNGILHNYSSFNISTIDSFFQKILRAFTYETGLASGFNIELNFPQILSQSIARFFDKDNSDKEITEWLSNYALDKIKNEKNWDIEKDINSFTSSIFNEFFFNLPESEIEKLSDLNNFSKYKSSLIKVVKAQKDKLQNLGIQAQEHLSKCGLSATDFSGGTRSVAVFMLRFTNISFYDKIEKLSVNRIKALNSEDNITGWAAQKSSKIGEIQQCVSSGLKDILQQINDIIENKGEVVNTALEILRNLDSFAVAAMILNEINELSREKNIFLLSFASPLLAKMIGNDDAPFIYEKTGDYLKNFMIDEFQDTSKLQWDNFLPLFYNAVSQQNRSLVVGDVKQSIYRWRNGDWTLLNSKIKQQFEIFGVDEKNLPKNWRSAPEIVNFNNEIFKIIPSISSSYIISDKMVKDYGDLLPNELLNLHLQTITDIYSTAQQEVPEKNKNKKGFVEVSFFDGKGIDKDEGVELRLEKMIQVLEQLFEKNIQPRDIAILVRKGAEGAAVASRLMEYIKQNPEKSDFFKFVSNDSVLLNSSSVVLLVIALLKFLFNNDDIESRAEILFFYNLLTNNPVYSARKLSHTNLKDIEAFFETLPQEFVNNTDNLKKQPLSAIVNNLLSIFVFKNRDFDSLHKQLPFIHTFQDFVLDYVKSNGNDISGFLLWWDEQGYKIPVSLSENQNAIRIITIHKSKGLEYDAVIMPFADWKLDHEPTIPNYIWCETVEPFTDFSAVPVRYSQSLINTKFQNDYFTERTMAFIDNINLFYVAVTRAAEALYIFAALPKSDNFTKISDILYAAVNSNDIAINNQSDDPLIFRTGELVEESAGKVSRSDEQKFEAIDVNNRNLRLRLSAKDLFTNDNEERTQSLNRGKVFHKIMENIITVNDIDSAVNSVDSAVLLPDTAEFKKQLTQILNSNSVKPWFSGEYKILNETTLLTTSGELKRPDRVMENDNKIIVVDYKFTSNKKYEHINQVKEYINTIKTIENKSVNGFVWYLPQNELVEVE